MSEGRDLGGLGEKSEGIKQKTHKQQYDTDNSMVITRKGVGEVEEGKGG